MDFDKVNNKMAKSIVILVFLILTLPKTAKAVIPPDFIFNIGTQIAQFFSLALIFLTAVFSAFWQFFKSKYQAIKHKKLALAGLITVIIAISAVATYYYAGIKQQAEYDKWLEQSIGRDM